MWKESFFHHLHTAAVRSIRLTPLNTHPLLIRDDVVAAVLLGQMWCQDVKAPAELRKHHVVWVSWRQGRSRNAQKTKVRGVSAANGEPTACFSDLEVEMCMRLNGFLMLLGRCRQYKHQWEESFTSDGGLKDLKAQRSR